MTVCLLDVDVFPLDCDVGSHGHIIQQLLACPVAGVHLGDNVTRLLKLAQNNSGRPVLPAATLRLQNRREPSTVRHTQGLFPC